MTFWRHFLQRKVALNILSNNVGQTVSLFRHMTPRLKYITVAMEYIAAKILQIFLILYLKTLEV